MGAEQVAKFQVAVQLGVLATLGLVTLASFLALVRAKEPIEFQGHWGGFGGALGGWRISRSLGLLMASLIFGGMFATVGGYSLAMSAKKDPEKLEDRKSNCEVSAMVFATPCAPVAVASPNQTPKPEPRSEKAIPETSVPPRASEAGRIGDQPTKRRQPPIISKGGGSSGSCSTSTACPPCSSEADPSGKR